VFPIRTTAELGSHRTFSASQKVEHRLNVRLPEPPQYPGCKGRGGLDTQRRTPNGAHYRLTQRFTVVIIKPEATMPGRAIARAAPDCETRPAHDGNTQAIG
jgi:hypothetical protein